MDGQLNVGDAILVMQHYSDPALTDQHLILADVNYDETVNLADSIIMMQIITDDVQYKTFAFRLDFVQTERECTLCIFSP